MTAPYVTKALTQAAINRGQERLNQFYARLQEDYIQTPERDTSENFAIYKELIGHIDAQEKALDYLRRILLSFP